jgi:hypothetical protein
MRSSIRQMTTIILLTVLLAPGLLHARTAPLRHAGPARVASVPELGIAGKLASVWSLLTSLLKTGNTLDPSGSPSSTTTTTTDNGDTGSTLDPSGTP